MDGPEKLYGEVLGELPESQIHLRAIVKVDYGSLVSGNLLPIGEVSHEYD